MARKSRFSTTSGPTRSSPDKGKSFKKNNRSKDDSGRGKEFSKSSRDSNFSDHKSAAKPRAGKGKPFLKKDWPPKKSTELRATGPDKNPAEFAERQPRSFSKETGSIQRRSPGGLSRLPGKDARTKPRERKSFIESRLDKQRQSRPVASDAETVPKDGLIRLNKFISNSGVCSRREADELIAMGIITVNGKSITEMGYKVKTTDDVRHDGKRLRAEKPVYILLNKPKGFITTTDDPQERNTVMHLIEGACKERVYPVGRLDRNTSGLLLLTNDGDLTEKLSHPSYNVKKIYKAELDRPLTKNDFQKILDGVHLEEGKAMIDDLAIVSEDGKTVGIELHIGWNRIVRRIFESLGYDVVKLDRSVYASLDKKDLPRGNWRYLRQDEVIRLKHFQ